MTTELFDRKPSAGAQLAKQFDWQARKIRGVYFPDLDKIPIADKAARQAQIQKIAGDCGCGFAAAVAVIATAIYGAALGFSAISVSASPFWNYASVAGVFVVAALAGKLMSQARNEKRLRSLRDEIKLEAIDALVRTQGRQT
jgi:hypothetical protein